MKYLYGMNIYKLCKGWERTSGGEETLLKKFTNVSKEHLLVILFDVRMYQLLRLLQLKLSFVLGSKNLLVKDLFS